MRKCIRQVERPDGTKNTYGLQRNGGQLLNKINSIAPYK